MKSSTTKLMTAFFVVAAIISFSFITKAKKETPKPKYTGHWIAVSGEEYMEVESAEIDDDAFQKDANGKMQHIDKNKVARKLNFRKLDKIEGKNVDKHYFLIGQDEPSADVNMVAPRPKKVWNACAPGLAGNYCRAITACFGGNGLPFSAINGTCDTGNQNFCLAYMGAPYAMQTPYMYYVLCTSTVYN